MFSCLIWIGLIWGVYKVLFHENPYRGCFEDWEYDGHSNFDSPDGKFLIRANPWPFDINDRHNSEPLTRNLALRAKYNIWREAVSEGIKRDRLKNNEGRNKSMWNLDKIQNNRTKEIVDSHQTNDAVFVNKEHIRSTRDA